MNTEYRRMQIARSTLLLDFPFFGVLALGLRLTEDPACDTAWTDGKSLGFNADFTRTLSADQLLGLIAHEVMHCACGHPWRRDGREHKQWNVAADHAINHVIRDAGLKLPDNVLLDDQYKGKWAEWIYDRIGAKPQQQSSNGNQGNGQQQSGTGQSQPGTDNGQPDQSQQPGNDPSSFGEVRDAPSDAGTPTESDWQQTLQQCSRMAKGRGTMAGSTLEVIDQISKPRVDWRSLLRRYVQDAARSDYSWTRPNTRYIPGGLYLPALNVPSMGRMVIAVDTSGSIDTVQLQQFAGEIDAIVADMQPESVDVIYCDTRVHRVDTFMRGEHVTMNAVGRGGTSFVPVFEHVETDGVPPVVLVYFTDLDGSFPSIAPDYPVVWAATDGARSVPFGDVVPCE